MSREHLGWVVQESGPPSADHAVLLLPGALATAAFYDDLLAEPSLREASIRFVATTLPGFGATPPPEDVSMENYARVAGTIAAELGCNAVVGHSLGANVAIEMADPRFLRRQTRVYLEYLDRRGSLAQPLCDSGTRAWVVFGEQDDIGLTDNERTQLEKCPHVGLVTIIDAGHFALNQRPGEIAELILDTIGSRNFRTPREE